MPVLLAQVVLQPFLFECLWKKNGLSFFVVVYFFKQGGSRFGKNSESGNAFNEGVNPGEGKGFIVFAGDVKGVFFAFGFVGFKETGYRNQAASGVSGLFVYKMVKQFF